MARISEFEQSGRDTVEIALSEQEFAQLTDPNDPLQLRITTLTNEGVEFRNLLVSTDPNDWVFDPDTNEYVHFEFLEVSTFGNHSINYYGVVLSSVNGAGQQDTVEDALMIGRFGGGTTVPLSTTVTEGTIPNIPNTSNIPLGTELRIIDQSVLSPLDGVNGNTDATLRFDAPDINTPISGRGHGLGDTGTSPPVCFVKGTFIETLSGDVRVEDLKVGDQVITSGNGAQTVLWVGVSEFDAPQVRSNHKLRPVKIKAGALGHNTPEKDLLVSRQHRIVVSSPLVEEMFGCPQIFVQAHQLTTLPGVSLSLPNSAVSYYHILLNDHDVLYANGAECESLFLGEQALEFLTQDDLSEIFEVIDRTKYHTLALPCPKGALQKKLVKKMRETASGTPFNTNAGMSEPAIMRTAHSN